jgi:hypothetical protein
MVKNELYDLPRPTSQTITGPILCLHSRKLTIDYDFERDDGIVEWIRVVFKDVLTFEYRQIECCQAEDLDAFNQIVKYPRSDWRKRMVDRSTYFLGVQANEKNADTYAHWRMYFDDVGCLDVIARSFDLGA